MSIFGLKTIPSSPHTVIWKSKVYEITSKHYLNSIIVPSLVCTSGIVWKHSFFQWSLELTGLIILKFGQKYLRIRTSSQLASCSNALHIIELLLITSFTNPKLERMFSRLSRVKTDYRNRLGQEQLGTFTMNWWRRAEDWRVWWCLYGLLVWWKGLMNESCNASQISKEKEGQTLVQKSWISRHTYYLILKKKRKVTYQMITNVVFLL